MLFSNGGQFEFLPVTIDSGGVVLKAILQLSLRAGFSFETPDITPGSDIEIFGFDLDNLQASAGVEARVYANIAELVTNVTENFSPDAECPLNVVQEYRFVVGAAAGATVGIGEHVWGPVANTEVPIYTTTLAETCVISSAVTVPTASLEARAPQDDDDDLSTTSTEIEETYTATQCVETGKMPCPATAQTLRERISTLTLSTAVPSGDEVTWPTSTEDLTVLSTVAFGKNAQSMVSATGKPQDYVPGDDEDDDDDKKTNVKLIIGLSVGLGVPFLLALAGAMWVALVFFGYITQTDFVMQLLVFTPQRYDQVCTTTHGWPPLGESIWPRQGAHSRGCAGSRPLKCVNYGLISFLDS